jgi:hypothetical protein
MQKIDFFGGLHGNYLELLINVFIHQNNYDITRPIFTKTGACHLKFKDPTYNRIIRSGHYSHFNVPFNTNDQVIRIVPTIDDMLIGLTNSLLRAGDQEFDLNNLEINTIKKLTSLPKAKNFLTTLTNDYGVQEHYSRHALRNYFYSMFETVEHGVNMFNNFLPDSAHYHIFPFRSFFNTHNLFYELNNTATFLEQNFYPTEKLMQLHEKFLEINQGYHSEIKCIGILNDIFAGRCTAINLNIIEEAWVNWQVARSLRCYNLPILLNDVYPTNTSIISQAIFEWKSKDYPLTNQ